MVDDPTYFFPESDDMTTVVWFRQDLRTTDNPALTDGSQRGPCIPLYVLDETAPPQGRPIGGAARWWLHHSLTKLSKSLGGLVILRGDPAVLVPEFAARVGATHVQWNRCYEPQAIARDTRIKAALTTAGVIVSSFNGALLHEPWTIKTLQGGPFKVYSPFWRACLKVEVGAPLPAPKIKLGNLKGLGEKLASMELVPTKPNWARGFDTAWTPGEIGASARLEVFLNENLKGYAELRNRPDLPNVSRLSPHLHFGEISPRQIWATAQHHAHVHSDIQKDTDKFLAEIGWREFAYHLLYHFPTLPDSNWKPAFNAYPWVTNAQHLEAWQRGQTGYPIVDAGLRELWTTGYMHNRVRMVVASFLIKHLRIDWRQGEAWFWDTLLDADLANNAASWQWVAGSGADAAPYFRIFNPMEQGRKFDPDGHSVRRWCPELSRLPNAVLHAPFDAPAEILKAAGVVLGATYPHPLVNHAEARAAALAGYASVKGVEA